MKTILPFEDITYHSPLTEKQVLKKLSNIINLDRSYSGSFTDNTFKLVRRLNPNQRNSFLPQIQGAISAQPTGTLIRVKMKLLPAVFIFMIVWLAMVSLFAIVFSKLAGDELGVFRVVPILMLVMGAVIPVVAFKYESSKSKKHLQQVFEAEVVE